MTKLIKFFYWKRLNKRQRLKIMNWFISFIQFVLIFFCNSRALQKTKNSGTSC